MGKSTSLLLCLALAGCTSALRAGSEAYHDGMGHLAYYPDQARADFLDADASLADALTATDLPTGERVTATSIRLRAQIELERHAEARALAALPIAGFEPAMAYSGDQVGLALLRARATDRERAFSGLLLAERQAQTLQARVHLAWEQVRLLSELDTPASRAEAARICERWPGRLDFDAQRKKLAP